jgi:two-component system chemotaxis response regulator CheB
VTRDPLRAIIVDDSAVVRKMLADAIAQDGDIQVVATAADPFIARDLILQHNPDVITLDVEMPRMDGLSFLRRIMERRPMPVLIVSAITPEGSAACVEALRLGAIDVIAKPGGPGSVDAIAEAIKHRIRSLRTGPAVRLKKLSATAEPAIVPMKAPDRSADGLLLVGASTGGTQAIETMLLRMPSDAPPILIVQHMPALFTKAFAARLNGICSMRVIEAAGGETIEPGTVYIAPGGRHMIVERHPGGLHTALRDGPPVHYQRPSVDVLFHSAAKLRGVPMAAAILTGMGTDGAEGLLALRQAGAETIAEDEQSCVVFGMPKEAIARGAARHVVSLSDMAAALLGCFERAIATPTAR